MCETWSKAHGLNWAKNNQILNDFVGPYFCTNAYFGIGK